MNPLSELPIIQAPMAGGPSTPALTAAVCRAGGYGFVAAGYLSADALNRAIALTCTLTGAPFGVNLFVPSAPGDAAQVAAYAATLRPEAERLGVALGEARLGGRCLRSKARCRRIGPGASSQLHLRMPDVGRSRPAAPGRRTGGGDRHLVGRSPPCHRGWR